jgi:hypothetical protein
VCLNEIDSKVRIGKNLSDAFHIENGLTQRMIIAILFKLYFKIRHQGSARKSGRTEMERLYQLFFDDYDDDDDNIVDENTNTMKKNIHSSSVRSQ